MRKPSSFVGGMLLGFFLGVVHPYFLSLMLPDRPIDTWGPTWFFWMLWVQRLLLGLPLAGFLVWCWMRRRAARCQAGGDAAPAQHR